MKHLSNKATYTIAGTDQVFEALSLNGEGWFLKNINRSRTWQVDGGKHVTGHIFGYMITSKGRVYRSGYDLDEKTGGEIPHEEPVLVPELAADSFVACAVIEERIDLKNWLDTRLYV